MKRQYKKCIFLNSILSYFLNEDQENFQIIPVFKKTSLKITFLFLKSHKYLIISFLSIKRKFLK